VHWIAFESIVGNNLVFAGLAAGLAVGAWWAMEPPRPRALFDGWLPSFLIKPIDVS
jgi:hypothetical protein